MEKNQSHDAVACHAACSAEGGSGSPNQTTSGRSRPPQRGQRGGDVVGFRP